MNSTSAADSVILQDSVIRQVDGKVYYFGHLRKGEKRYLAVRFTDDKKNEINMYLKTPIIIKLGETPAEYYDCILDDNSRVRLPPSGWNYYPLRMF